MPAPGHHVFGLHRHGREIFVKHFSTHKKIRKSPSDTFIASVHVCAVKALTNTLWTGTRIRDRHLMAFIASVWHISENPTGILSTRGEMERRKPCGHPCTTQRPSWLQPMHQCSSGSQRCGPCTREAPSRLLLSAN